jgi:hypothetical protein
MYAVEIAAAKACFLRLLSRLFGANTILKLLQKKGPTISRPCDIYP